MAELVPPPEAQLTVPPKTQGSNSGTSENSQDFPSKIVFFHWLG